MKDKIKPIIIVVVLVLLVLVVALLAGSFRKVAISDIQTFRYIQNNSMERYGYLEYDLECEEDMCTAYVKLPGVTEEDKDEFPVDTDFCEELEGILEKYSVGSWNGFDEADKNILDGGSFSLNITMKNQDVISAHGYMKYPKNYSKFVEELTELFDSLERGK